MSEDVYVALIVMAGLLVLAIVAVVANWFCDRRYPEPRRIGHRVGLYTPGED